jgi:hypothetical protein
LADGAQVGVRITWPEDALWPQGGYGNAILVNHTPWDFTLRVGHVTLPANFALNDPDGPSVGAQPVAQITLPPVAVAQLAAILQDQIAKYTAAYGPIGGNVGDGIA